MIGQALQWGRKLYQELTAGQRRQGLLERGVAAGRERQAALEREGSAGLKPPR